MVEENKNTTANDFFFFVSQEEKKEKEEEQQQGGFQWVTPIVSNNDDEDIETSNPPLADDIEEQEDKPSTTDEYLLEALDTATPEEVEEEKDDDESFWDKTKDFLGKANKIRTNTQDAWATWSLRTVGGLMSSLELLPAMSYDTTSTLFHPLFQKLGLEEQGEEAPSYLGNFRDNKFNMYKIFGDSGSLVNQIGNRLSPLLETDKDFETNLKDKKYTEAAEQLWYMINENAPQLLVQLGIGATGGLAAPLGLSMIGLSTAGQEWNQLKDEGRLESRKAGALAIFKGVAELVGEALFSQPIFNNMFQDTGAQRVFTDKLANVMLYKMGKATGMNVVEENTVNVLGNMGDLVTENYDPEDGAPSIFENWISTTGVSAGFGLGTGAIDIALDSKTKKDLKKIEQAIEETAENKSQFQAIQEETNQEIDKVIEEKHPEVAGTPDLNEETNIEGGDLNEQEIQEQQEQTPEKQREVLRGLEEKSFEEGVFEERNRGVLESNNDSIANSTIQRFEPMTPQGSPSFEVNDSQLYFDTLKTAKDNNKYGAFVDLSNPEDLAGKRLFLYNGGAAGFAIESDGNITNVFKNTELTNEKGIADEMLLRALEEGGNKLDFYDGKLTVLYGKHGFTPVARTAFVDEFAPDDWNFTRDGRPDVVFAVHNGDSIEQVIEKGQNEGYTAEQDFNVEEAPRVEDYDTGKAIQFEALEQRQQQETSELEKIAKTSLTREEFLTRIFFDEEIDFNEHDLDTSQDAIDYWEQVTNKGTEFEIDDSRTTIDEDIEQVQQKLETVDIRTKEGRKLKQDLENLKKLKAYQDTPTEELNQQLNILNNKLEQLDGRTKEARDIKQEIKAIEGIKNRRQAEAIFQQQLQKQVAWLRQANSTVEKDMSQLKEDYLENGIEMTKEQEAELKTVIKPSKGFAFNTTRIKDVDSKVQQVLLDVATITRDNKNVTFEDIDTDAAEYFSTETSQELARNLGLLQKDAEIAAAWSKKSYKIARRLREVLTSNAKVIAETVELINEASGTLSDIELAMFAHRLAVQEALSTNLDQIVGNAARTTSLQRVYVNGEMIDMYELTPQQFVDSPDARAKAKDLIDSFGGRDDLIKLAKELVSKYQGKSEEGLTPVVNKSIRETKYSSRLMDALIQYRSTNVLMNLSTHITNIMSQTGRTMLDSFINYIEASYNLAFNEKDAMTFGKANAELIGALEGVMRAFKRPIVSMEVAGELVLGEAPSTMDLLQLAMRDPIKFEQIREATEITRNRMQVENVKTHALSGERLLAEDFQKTPVGDLLKKAIDYYGGMSRNIAFGGLQAGDAPFAYAGYFQDLAGSLYRLSRNMEDGKKYTLAGESLSKQEFLSKLKDKVIAYRTLKTLEPLIERELIVARAHDTTGKSPQQIRSEIIEKYIGKELRGIKPREMEQILQIDNSAEQYAQEVTWKDEFEKGTMGRAIEDALRNDKLKWIKAFQLFIHTPAKIMSYASKNSISPKTWGAALGTQGRAAQVKALASLTSTALIMVAGGILYSSNHLTPAARDKKERERMYQAGVMPNSIRIDDKWYSYNRIEPMSYFLSAAANGSRAYHEALNDPSDKEGNLPLRIASSTFWDIFQTTFDKSYFKGIKDVIAAVTGDGSKYYAENFMDSMVPMYSMKRNLTDYSYGGMNPYYNEFLMEDSKLPKRDIFGKPIVNYKSISGLNPTPMATSPIRQELFDLQHNLSGFGKTLGGVKLSDSQYNDLLRYLDEEMHVEEKLNELVNSSGYKSLGNRIDLKKEQIDKLWLSLKSKARKSLYQDPEFLLQYRETQEQKLQGTTGYPSNMFQQQQQQQQPTSPSSTGNSNDIVDVINMFNK